MKQLHHKVDECTYDFTCKIERLIKDFKLRFADFAKYTSQLQHLSTKVEYLNKHCQSKTTNKLMENRKDQTVIRDIKKNVETVGQALVSIATEVN